MARQPRRVVIRSIRYTLMLWYVGMLTLILCVFSGMLYTIVAKALLQDVDNSLSLQAGGVAETISAFWQAQRAAPQSGPGNWQSTPAGTLEQALEPERLSPLIDRWAEKTGALMAAQPIRLLDPSGRVLAESSGMRERPLPVSSELLQQAEAGQPVYDVVQLFATRMRVITYPVVEGRVRYVVQVAASLDHTDAWLYELRLWLFWLIPCTLIVTSAVGWFLAMAAMRPVGQMITQAQRVSAEHLDSRIDVPRTGDELEWLAVTFNDMLARLERAFRRLQQFSAAASHELRTPLTIMRGELEVALRKPRGAAEYQRVLHAHLDAIQEMSRIVEELLLLARTRPVPEAMAWEPVELVGLAKAVGEGRQSVADSKAVRLVLEGREPVWVLGERRLLERVIANLLDNAIRHTPSEGAVTVHPESRGAEACLVVRDTGTGIPLEELPQIFDRFFRKGPPPAGEKPGGLGLGLCRWIVEAHNGRIDVASPPEQGAIFTISLPSISPPR